MRILHQAGHNTIWNIKSLNEDGCGDGLIFSPVHNDVEYFENLDTDLKECSLFDPQFYVPNSQKSKLISYDFFPESIMNGFGTTDYMAIAHESARLCVEFQLRHNFRDIIIPSRFYEDLLTDFIERQKAFSVSPFLDELEGRKLAKDVFLSLSLTAPMVVDKRFRNNILNWVSSYQQIDGVYLQVDFGESTKLVHDYDKLYNYISFIGELIDAELEVICGYLNVEALLAAIFDVNSVTIGAFENTRIFSIDKFLVNDTIKMGPAPRIYLPKLLNWIRYDTAIEIKEDFPDLWEKIYTPTDYSEGVINDTTRRPHFSQPALYKHYFLLMCEQLNCMKPKEKEERAAWIIEQIKNAHSLYQEVEDSGVLLFDANCKGEHLPVWNRVVRNVRKSF